MEKFSASIGCAAVTAGGNLGGLGNYPSTSVLAGRKPTKIANVYMFALIADLRNLKQYLIVRWSIFLF
jgi:hypothetical protein